MAHSDWSTWQHDVSMMSSSRFRADRWGPADVSMTSSMLTGQRATRLGLDWVLVGLDGARFGLGSAHHVACCGAATSRPWASTGLWSTARGPRWTHAPVYGGPPLLPVNRVHTSPLTLVSTCTGCLRMGPARGIPLFLLWLCFRRWRAPDEPPWWRWCPIREGKGFPRPRRS